MPLLRDIEVAVPRIIVFSIKAESVLIWTAGLPMVFEYQEKFIQDSSEPGVRIRLPVETEDLDCQPGSHFRKSDI